MKEHKEIIEFRYDTQLLLDKYGADDDECDDLVDEIRDHIISTFQGDSLIVAGDTGEDDFGGEKSSWRICRDRQTACTADQQGRNSSERRERIRCSFFMGESDL